VAVQSRGHLNPGDHEVTLDRFRIGLPELVRHVWVARWNIPPGETRPQRVLTYPACNAVIMPDEARVYGPARHLLVRELAGRSWAVGIMFQASAGPLLTTTPVATLPAVGEPLAADVGTQLRGFLEDANLTDERRWLEVTAALRAWLLPLAERVGASGRLANELCRLAEERDDIARVDELAAAAGTTPRTAARLIRAHLGVSPKWLIERRRLQAAAIRLSAEPATELAALAAELGYSDQPHFTRRYRSVLGETPNQTRRAAGAAR
jgi:AraC-like DNA-binding protein